MTSCIVGGARSADAGIGGFVEAGLAAGGDFPGPGVEPLARRGVPVGLLEPLGVVVQFGDLGSRHGRALQHRGGGVQQARRRAVVTPVGGLAGLLPPTGGREDVDLLDHDRVRRHVVEAGTDGGEGGRRARSRGGGPAANGRNRRRRRRRRRRKRRHPPHRRRIRIQDRPAPVDEAGAN